LEGAFVLVHDQLDETGHEALVAVAIGRLRELRRQQEVKVAGRGVPRHARQEFVLPEQRLDVACGLGDPRRGHADVLDDERGALGPKAAHDSLHSLAYAPEDLYLLGVAREARSFEEVAIRDRGKRTLLESVELGRVP